MHWLLTQPLYRIRDKCNRSGDGQVVVIREGLGDMARDLSREFTVHYRKSGLTIDPSLYLAVIYMANPRTPGAPRVGGYAEICYFFRKFFTGNGNLNAKVDF